MNTKPDMVRAEFEAWAKSESFCVDRFRTGQYEFANTEVAWLGWEAARFNAPTDAGVRDKLRDAVLSAWEHYERMGEICHFEGNPMIYAATLEELADVARSVKPSVKSREQAIAEFTTYFTANYPPDTAMCDPAWHAPRIFRAVESAMKSSPQDGGPK